MGLTTVPPSRVPSMGFGLVNQLQFQRLKRGELMSDSINNSGSHN